MKTKIRITAEDLKDLKDGYSVGLILNGLPAYITQVDYETGLKFKGMNIGINCYYASNPKDFQIELD